jgi:hypothetical protein
MLKFQILRKAPSSAALVKRKLLHRDERETALLDFASLVTLVAPKNVPFKDGLRGLLEPIEPGT